MAKYRITAPDGGTYEVTAPDGASEAEVLAYAQQNYKPKVDVSNDAITKGAKEFAGQGSEALGGVSQAVLNALGGAVRGAGSIGATLARPFESGAENEQRRAGIDANMASVGAQPDSLMYKGGKLGGEIAGTAGVGNALAMPARALSGLSSAAGAGAIPALDIAAKALSTGGFRTGAQLPALANLATRAGAGAAVGGVSAGMVNPGDAGMGAVIGGALPGVTQLAGKAGNAVRRSMGGASPEVAALAKRAQDLGINIPADRLVDSKPLNAVAAALNYIPGSGRAATEDAMASQLNKALSGTFGQNSSNVTQALRKAESTLGGQFDDFLRSNTVRIDKQFMDDLAEAGSQAAKELGSDQAGIINKQIDAILEKAATGEIEGQAAYNIKKTLDRIGARNSPEAWYALDLKKKLMEALNRSVGPEQAKGFGQLRQQYGNMLDLQKLAKNGVEGEISVARLANMKNIRNPQMQELADIAAQFVKPREGQHGAAQRALVGAAGFGLGGLPGLATGVATGRAANMALNSNAARGLLMGPQMVGEPQTLGLLTQGAYRSLPLLAAQ